MDIPEIHNISEQAPQQPDEPKRQHDTVSQKPVQRQPGGAPAQPSGLFSFNKGQQYYTSTGRKVGDFFIGFLSPFFFTMIIWFITLAIISLTDMHFLLPFGGAVIFIFHIAAFFLCFRYGRKWIAMGLISHYGLMFLLSFLLIILFLLMYSLG